MSRCSVALVQIAVRDDESAAARLARGLDLLAKFDRPVQFAVLPELWTAGFFNFDQYASLAETLDGPTAKRLAEAASRGGFWLHGGSLIESAPDGNLYNTSLLFDPRGNLAATYRKIHLFGIDSAEKAILKGGESPVNLASEIGNLGLTTCYDLRFPELYRALSSRGAEVTLVCATWPAARLEHWLILARARAIENLSYVLACNAAGSNRGVDLGGNSIIIDPWGRVLAQAGDRESVVYAEINREEVAAIRARFPALGDRRVASS